MSTRRLLLLGVLCMGLTCAWSQAAEVIVLPDPTRPPGAVLRAMSAKNPGGQAALPAASAAPAAAEAASGASAASRPVRREARLTSVRVSPSLGNVALIDGQMVQVGDRVGDSTVVSIDDDGVALRGSRGLERLSLTPAASKRWPGSDSPAKGGAKERR